ncbi:MAG: carbon-nitrogen hydrolase family protein, partial [Proteobacteria bacterium]|nr:carbon-nitrogen hydrolase family protein [Pseudomonadota bacterium]
TVGLTICYDIRFPNLYRDLAQAGAKLIFSPAAFTKVTGEAHWHVLQRARAIENGCFIVSPAQTGTHAGGRQTYGHSVIVAPWGEVLADGGTEPGVVLAEVDLAAVDTARGKVPSLTHDRDYSRPASQTQALRETGD